MEDILKELNEFLGEAALNTYASGGGGIDPEMAEKGMKELEYGDKNGKWYYKDSYAGFFQSWGRETVWLDGKPFWTQIYGGGMETPMHGDATWAHKTFDFLKKALSAGEKKKFFQPRGPTEFKEGDWEYSCKWKGNIKKFSGSETIAYRKEIVFTHDFAGGLFLYR